MVKYITGTIRYDDREQRRHFKSAAKKLGLPLNRFMILALQRLTDEVTRGNVTGVQRNYDFVTPEDEERSIVTGGTAAGTPAVGMASIAAVRVPGWSRVDQVGRKFLNNIKE